MSFLDNIGSIVGGVVGGAIGAYFGGPAGAEIGESIGAALGNEIQQAVGDGTKGAADDLSQNHGMPDYARAQVYDAVDREVRDHRHNVPPEVQQAVRDQWGSALQNFQQLFQQYLVRAVLDNMGDQDSKPHGKGGGGGGWLQAIAKAMGHTLGEKAAEMVHLSKEMSSLQQSGSASDADNARQFNEDMTKFQATSQEYAILQNTFSTAIKSLGEALSGMARKQ